MQTTVRLFAVLRHRAGSDSLSIELPDGATVADAIAHLSEREELREVLESTGCVMAVNREYAQPGQQLCDGDELALIPPVSGGAPLIHAAVTNDPLNRELAELVRSPGAGAIVTFEGTTRIVEQLDYEAYTEMAEPLMRRILEECLARHRLQAIAAEHRVGVVPLSEPAVIVAASAAHRDEAFAGAREAIDRIKSELPIWKREQHEGAQQWVEGTLP